ncbi:MAG: UvrD-helicase domain-containing protein, partial [Desulfovibrionaceae bacterium]|nr:UvrD-helicase domain-containing protein [Desulfovibrionaceae bacterium]
MNRFRADLHIHSRFSRATSKTLSVRQLAAWARVKGLSLLGAGDFTHPGWLAEIEETLSEGGDGLLHLKKTTGLEREIPWLADFPMPGDVRFMLQTEISLIYKRAGKVRKIHNLVFMPGLAAVKKFNAKLAKVGNLASDGRPILGLDSRHLLEMALETDPGAFLVPAHIWTPWFSLFGSKSGFDSIEECFGSLAPEIFALETGLSSDPEMNWLLSSLDRFRLISNSDAHSGEKLGREANVFAGEMSYEGVRRALKHGGRGDGGDGGGQFLGTVEFFPEEGKYHMDGHRACGVVLDPRESRARGGLCPACGKPLTIGVLSRVLELADRDQPAQPKDQPGFSSLIPLAEIVGEVLACGPATKKAKDLLARLIGRLGPELDILQDVAVEDVAKYSRPLAEALARMRRGEVIRQPGYDGEFGRITLFSDRERREFTSGRVLAAAPRKGPTAVKPDRTGQPGRQVKPGLPDLAANQLLTQAANQTGQSGQPGQADPAGGLNAKQREAVASRNHRLLVVAGPGTGKTHTLIARIRALLDAGARPGGILAVTFTRRAASELVSRLARQEDAAAQTPRADTLHALAFEYWTQATGQAPVLLSEQAARALFASACPELSGTKLKAAWNEHEISRQRSVAPQPPRPAAAGSTGSSNAAGLAGSAGSAAAAGQTPT